MAYKIPLEQILEVTSYHTGLTVEELKSPYRMPELHDGRSIFTRAARNYYHNIASIGRLLNRTHATIINCLKTHENRTIEKYYKRCYEETMLALLEVENGIITERTKIVINTPYGEREAEQTIKYSKLFKEYEIK